MASAFRRKISTYCPDHGGTIVFVVVNEDPQKHVVGRRRPATDMTHLPKQPSGEPD